MGAVVAGVAFAFAPFRLEQDGHLQVISSGGIPLALAFGIRGIRLRRPSWLFWAWVVAAWQVSIGWILGLPFAYGLAGAVAIAVVGWLVRGRPPVPRRMVIACGAGIVFFVAFTYLIAHPYIQIADEFPEARRSPHEVAAFSGPLKVLLTAPEENFIWGEATAGFRDSLPTPSEKTLFPGLMIVLLALVGLASRSLSRRWRVGLGIAAVLFIALELGFREEGGLLWPYRVLYELLPGWDAIRTPGRLATFSSLALALLAAAGAEAVLRAARRRRLPAWSPAAIAGILALAIVTEGRSLPFDPFDDQAMPEVPPHQPSTTEIPTPQLHLPARTAKQNRAYQLASADGFPDMVNGRASTNPSTVLALVAQMDSFPDAASVARLQEYGVRTVVLHVGLTDGTAQAGAARKPIDGLPLTRCRLPRLIVYEVESSSASPGASPRSRAGRACDFG
jgi:hypothetical protein